MSTLKLKDNQEKPLGNFLNSILNFNSLIPSNKELEEKDNKKKKQVIHATIVTNMFDKYT